MSVRVDLIWLASKGDPPAWELGEAQRVHPSVDAINAVIGQGTNAAAWLIWDARLGMPDEAVVARCAAGIGDVWHGGLRLGMGGKPALIDMVAPTWMLNRDPADDIEASSWRVSLRACLMRSEVVQQMGGLTGGFETLDGAALEFGHRCMTRGVIMRHVPELVRVREAGGKLPFADELRFVHHRFGAMWRDWSVVRAVMSGDVDLRTAWRARVALKDVAGIANPAPYRASRRVVGGGKGIAVTVIIPTLGRYAYLERVLDQLGGQTIRPKEIIVIDQTAVAERDRSLSERFAHLPLVVIEQDQPGQCTARNTAIERSSGDFLLFIDDDDEVPPTLIEDHWRNLQGFEAEVSCGGVDEVGAGALPAEFRYTQISSVFPTNNTMIRRGALAKSGVFDAAYDRTFMDDADLGMRLYLSGALMIYDPDIRVVHHHAGSGGLRAYRQRVITYASSRARITHRSLPSVSEIFYPMRYFTARQVRESLWLRVLGTFSVRGGWIKKLMKVAISGVMLPHTLWVIGRRYRQARAWRSQVVALRDSTTQR